MELGGFGLDEEPDSGHKEIDLERIMDNWEIENRKLAEKEKKVIKRIFNVLGYNHGGGRFLKRRQIYEWANKNYALVDMLIEQNILVHEETLDDFNIDHVNINEEVLYQLNMKVLYNL